jgi:hypothetical protein
MKRVLPAAVLLAGVWIAEGFCAPAIAVPRRNSPLQKKSARARPDPAPPVFLAARFQPGQTLRYALAVRTSSDSSTSGGMEDMQGRRRAEMATDVFVRLGVLGVEPDPARPGRFLSVRLRATYEKISVEFQSNTPDAAPDELAAGLRALEGRWLEVTLLPDGTASDLSGLEDVAPETRNLLAEYLSRLSAGVRQPEGGIRAGQKWALQLAPAAGLPLDGVFYKAESEYLRNEPCPAVSAPLAPAAPLPPVNPAASISPDSASASLCAVILTRAVISQRQMRDPTPGEFRARGLRTSGVIGGQIESLAYVSLETGFTVSVTQESDEQADVTFLGGRFEKPVRTQSRVQSRSVVSLLK